MFEKHKAQKALEKHQESLARWQAQRDGMANLLEVAQGFNGEGTTEVMLKSGEALFYKVTSCSLVEERRGAGHYQGGSTGVSIPIGSIGGRSVRYRVGANRGHYVQGAPVPTAIDTGTVFITNQRVIFAGSKQTRECLFAKTISISHDDSDGETTISVSNRQKPTVLHYGAALSGSFDFRLELAIAHFNGTLPQLIDNLTTQLTQIDGERPPDLEAPPVAPRPLLPPRRHKTGRHLPHLHQLQLLRPQIRRRLRPRITRRSGNISTSRRSSLEGWLSSNRATSSIRGK